MRTKTWTVGMLIPLGVAGAAVTTAPTATAAVQDVGSCAGRKFDFRRSQVILEANNTRDGRILLVLTIGKTERGGQAWRVRITQNDAEIFAEDAVTTGPTSPFQPFGGSGALHVTKVLTNLPGVDRFGATATNRRTGETCTATDQELVLPPDRL